MFYYMGLQLKEQNKIKHDFAYLTIYVVKYHTLLFFIFCSISFKA